MGLKRVREQGAWKQKNNRIQGALKILPRSAQKTIFIFEGSREHETPPCRGLFLSVCADESQLGTHWQCASISKTT